MKGGLKPYSNARTCSPHHRTTKFTPFGSETAIFSRSVLRLGLFIEHLTGKEDRSRLYIKANFGERRRLTADEPTPGRGDGALIGYIEKNTGPVANLWVEIVDPSGREIVASRIDELGNFTITIPESSTGDLGLRIMDRDAKKELFNEDLMGERPVLYRDIQLK